MRRSHHIRAATAITTVTLALTGVACTGEDAPGTGVETEDPIVLDPGEEQGESFAPADPAEADNGTDG